MSAGSHIGHVGTRGDTFPRLFVPQRSTAREFQGRCQDSGGHEGPDGGPGGRSGWAIKWEPQVRRRKRFCDSHRMWYTLPCQPSALPGWQHSVRLRSLGGTILNGTIAFLIQNQPIGLILSSYELFPVLTALEFSEPQPSRSAVMPATRVCQHTHI